MGILEVIFHFYSDFCTQLDMTFSDKISTSALAKRLGVPTTELFKELELLGWIVRLGEQWELTSQGREQQGEVRQSRKFGAYIVWPEALKIAGNVALPDYSGKKVTATTVAQQLGLSPRTINLIFAELGWLIRDGKGWRVTARGIAQGAAQRKSVRDVPYALWPEEVMSHPAVVAAVKGVSGDLAGALGFADDSLDAEMMAMFPAHYHTLDGRAVCSRLELVAANWLYLAGVVFSYRRALSDAASLRPDFYLPAAGLMIECWHSEHEARYVRWKCEKIERLKALDLHVLELKEGQLASLESILVAELRQRGITL
ncbi:hypothetical protein [Neptunomonas marina]|uniref:Uncharacterized protein n=1 Tax=Neptunomonas marina TaxID=1815562 RepID=A0A437Q655_9GAMM|nr:hypothetical protein [Neptunomonas marina]RVU29984.1 hypothetical protein EOE65_13060 [Neptunomonas marina]